MTIIDKWLLYGMAAGLSILLILRDVNGISISKFIYFGYAIIFMVAANYQTLVKMLCFILPLVCGLPGTYIMLVAFVLLILKRGSVKFRQLVPIICILLLELFASFWYPSADFVFIVNYVSFAAVMIFLIQDDRKIDYRYCVMMYLLATALLCYVILAATFADAPKNWIKLFSDGRFRIGEVHAETEQMTLKINANSLAYYSVVGIACGLLLTEQAKGGKKVWYIALTVLFAAAGFLTLSRSWMLIASACLLLYILSKLRNPKQFLALFLVLAVVALWLVYYFGNNPELWAGFETRFTDETVGDGGGRGRIFKNYMEIFFSDIRFVLTGAGVTQLTAAVGTIANLHNGTQQILVCCGLIGFALYMIVLFGPVIKVSQGNRIRLVYWIPLISVVVFTQTIQFLNPTMLMLPYVMGIYGLRMSEEPKRKISEAVHGE